MKFIHVAAAIIQKDGRIFATQRGYGAFKDGWEFPGGKIEPGESAPAALKREIKEELDTDINVGELCAVSEYDYPDFHISMECYWCTVQSGHLSLLEHEDARWLPADQLEEVNWLPADAQILDQVKKGMKKAGDQPAK
ncbi:(deoxy)nucleoside triphosphate pyrophosphohydrolase [Catenisphaera adipataccumulans]|uniref:8-oxo-dGTP diphosphatase n=1 Tax=Catenisphaera adipataccumulans TaxID=700500 RepID=A0A7W8CVF7_9FIRM|nr:(deoxy)nucleoside triphosphate pyrophosphohydrolase [Catenisphaera adipataccumulans]MBB5182352.1 8-oxo-dGTP diphosphatase [Catenisphaera adipataccumulans]